MENIGELVCWIVSSFLFTIILQICMLFEEEKEREIPCDNEKKEALNYIY